MNALIKYPGAKWSISKWIVDYFPEQHSYVEPFFGSGAVFFNKDRSNIETVNDLDGNVVNLFECIREDPERLAKELYYTPYARDVFENTYKDNPKDRYSRAINFIIRLNMGHGYRTNGEKVGWKIDIQGRERAYATQSWAGISDKIYQVAERLRGVQIENRPAVNVIKRFNDKKVLIYCDPPYLLNTRYREQYEYEMSDADHAELLQALKEHSGYVVISGYDSDLYNEMLSGFYKESTTCYTQANKLKQECIWMNFEPQKQISFV